MDQSQREGCVTEMPKPLLMKHALGSRKTIVRLHAQSDTSKIPNHVVANAKLSESAKKNRLCNSAVDKSIRCGCNFPTANTKCSIITGIAYR